MLESLELVGRYLAHLITHEVDFFLWDVDHFTDHCIKQASLSTSNRANDDNELSFFYLQVDVLDIQDVVKAARWERNVKVLASLWFHFAHPFANPCLSLFKPFFFSLFSFLLKFIFLLIVQQAYAPAEATLNTESILRFVILVRRLLINETLLNFGREIETIQTHHRIC